MTQYHVYLDGNPTKGIFNSLEEAKMSCTGEIAAKLNIEIVTVNSPSPIQRWYFDHAAYVWVKSE